MRFFFFLMLSSLLLSSCEKGSSLSTGASPTGVVYGDDSRRDLTSKDALTPEIRRAVEATAAVMSPFSLAEPKDGKIKISGRPLKQARGLCDGVAFADQTSASYCTAVLVSANRILTAGHCVGRDVKNCETMRFVFGWTLESGDQVGVSDVYSCRRILHFEQDFGDPFKTDMALIELDRDVTGREPVPVSFEALKAGEPVFSSGHPNGIPRKFSEGAVFAPADGASPYARAEVDTFSGDSGGPIFDGAGVLRAILMGGETDYEQISEPPFCRKVHVCKNHEDCSGEYLLQLKPEHLEPKETPKPAAPAAPKSEAVQAV